MIDQRMLARRRRRALLHGLKMLGLAIFMGAVMASVFAVLGFWLGGAIQ